MLFNNFLFGHYPQGVVLSAISFLLS